MFWLSFLPVLQDPRIAFWIQISSSKGRSNLLCLIEFNSLLSTMSFFFFIYCVARFESVLTTLEDAVTDAPKASEFLGRILGRVVVENVVSLKEIGRLLHEGGEEPGSLLKFGLAGDVLGSVLEMIKAEKGQGVLNEIRNASNLRLEDFRPPPPNRSRILEKFI